MPWLDFENTFDLVPHEWVLKSLHLSKLPENLIRTTEHLTSLSSTFLHVKVKKETILSDTIHFAKGIFQGGSLAVLLFVWLVNTPLFLLNKHDGHACRKHKNYNNAYNFLVDDLKSYASSTNTSEKQLNLVAAFSENNGVIFGEDK